jgi:hypothetical protein
MKNPHHARFPYDRISPLNIPALAYGRDPYHIAGNPVSTRPESAIANCFPGLEMDHRNLDCRFFPGLIFEFLDTDDVNVQGGRLIATDLNDPDLDGQLKKEVSAFDETLQKQPAEQKLAWYLESLQQPSTGPVYMHSEDGKTLLDGSHAWRLVRTLDPAPVTIVIQNRKTGESQTFHGTRRTFVNTEGRISDAIRPGELTQSLCSPWQHDFRDCSCLYWASNHPDIALPANPATFHQLEGEDDAEAADLDILWLRRDRNPDARTLPLRVQDEDRPLELDHYELNQRWQELNFVLEGREIPAVYKPGVVHLAPSYTTVGAMAEDLEKLASIELALALEYLYAMYSLGPERAKDAEREDVEFAKHELLALAVSEMRHLRWANQIRWELHHAGLLQELSRPVIRAAPSVPTGDGKGRCTCMRPVSLDVLSDFIDAEKPSGSVEGLYAKVFATVRGYYELPYLPELVSRIIADGIRHYSRLREVRLILSPHLKDGQSKIVRELHILKGKAADPKQQDCEVADISHEDYASVREQCEILKLNLSAAYSTGDMEDAPALAEARTAMVKLHGECEKLATEKQLGVPFKELFA